MSTISLRDFIFIQKHFSGRHDQRLHGNRYSGTGAVQAGRSLRGFIEDGRLAPADIHRLTRPKRNPLVAGDPGSYFTPENPTPYKRPGAVVPPKTKPELPKPRPEITKPIPAKKPAAATDLSDIEPPKRPVAPKLTKGPQDGPAARRLLDRLQKEEDADQARYEDAITDIKRRQRDYISKNGAANPELTDLMSKTRAEQLEVHGRYQDRTFEALFPGRANIKLTNIDVGRFTGVQADHVREGIKSFTRLVGQQASTAAVGRIHPMADNDPHAFGGRSYHNPLTREIVLGKSAGPHVVIHELGHWFELGNNRADAAAKAFYKRRTAGEEPKWMGPGYDRSEVTRRDKFLNKYMGKVYGIGTELVSMGLEEMMNPAEFSRRDSDYFDFMYSILRD